MSLDAESVKKAFINTLQAEQGVIGSLLIKNELINEIDLDVDHFYSTECAMIYAAIQGLHSERKPFDLMTVNDWLSNHKNVDYFTTIAEYVHKTPSAANGLVYAEKVREYWRSREACRIADELIAIRGNNDQTLIDKAITQLMGLNISTTSHDHDSKTVLDKALAYVEKAHKAEDGVLGLRTGINEIDSVMGGLHKSDLIVIGARPAMGKTALLLNMLTRNPNMSAGIMSGEQSADQVGMRLLSIHGSVNGARMRAGRMDDDEYTNITVAVSRLKDRGFRVNDKTSMSINDIERQARKWVYQDGVNVIGVDYLQKIKHPNEKLSTTEKIGDIAVRLKDLAKELNVPVVALAQVNREVEKRNDKRPQQADLKDCGIIEQEADQIITIYRDEVYNENTSDQGIAELFYCKNRHGMTCIRRVKWVANYMQFLDFEQRYSA